MNENISLAIIGGTGLYAMDGLSNIAVLNIDTPFGNPSSPIVVGELEDRKVAFLARHGIGHTLLPSEINFRANFYALKSIGVSRVISVNAVGSLRLDYAPGDLVVPDQVFDLTRDRQRSFFGNGLVAHVSVADPFCCDLSNHLATSALACGCTVHQGGTFLTIEGPRFSTKAESNLFRSWGMSIIGMNTAPEAFLAKEAEMCFSVMAHVTDYDTWHASDEPVSVEIVMEQLAKNSQIAQKAIRNLVQRLPLKKACSCENSMKNAFITQPEMIPLDTRRKLDLLIRKYFPE